MSSTQNVGKDDFEAKVINSDKAVIVDFYADWCGPCKALAPTLEEIAAENADNAIVVKVNADTDGDLAAKYGVRGLPTLLFFKGGKVIDTLVGNQPKQEILMKLKTIL